MLVSHRQSCRRTIVILSVLLLVSCTVPSAPHEQARSNYEKDVENELRALMQEYFATWNQVTCENWEPILRFYDYSGSGFISGRETTVMRYSGDAWPKWIAEGACSRTREEGVIDSLIVTVLSPDIATVSLTYHGTYYEPAGPRQARGTLLQVFTRTSSGWKTPVEMSTHLPLAPK